MKTPPAITKELLKQIYKSSNHFFRQPQVFTAEMEQQLKNAKRLAKDPNARTKEISPEEYQKLAEVLKEAAKGKRFSAY